MRGGFRLIMLKLIHETVAVMKACPFPVRDHLQCISNFFDGLLSKECGTVAG